MMCAETSSSSLCDQIISIEHLNGLVSIDLSVSVESQLMGDEQVVERKYHVFRLLPGFENMPTDT